MIVDSFHRIGRIIKNSNLKNIIQLKHLRIRLKLLIGFFIIAICTAIIGIVGFYGLNTIRLSQNDIAYINLPKITSLKEMQTSQLYVMLCERLLSDVNIIEDNVQRNKQYRIINENLANLNRNIKLFESIKLTKNEQAAWLEYKELLDKWKESHKNFSEYSKQIDYHLQIGFDPQSERIHMFIQHMKNQSIESENLFNMNDSAINELISINQSQAQKAGVHGNKIATFITILFITISIFAIAIAISIGLFLSRYFEKGLDTLTNASEKIMKGETEIDIDIKSKDELGLLGDSFKEMMIGIKEQSNIASEIANGNFDIEITPRSEKDILNYSMMEMKNHIKLMYSEIKKIVTHIESGDFLFREKNLDLTGGWKEITIGINHILDVFMEHLDQLPIIIMTIDNNYNIQYLNQEGCTIIGEEMVDIQGKKCYDFFKNNYCETDSCICCKALKENQIYQSPTQLPINGDLLYFNNAGIPIKDSYGNVVGAFEIMIDETAVKKAEIISDKQIKYQKDEVEKLIIALDGLANGDLHMSLSEAPFDNDTDIMAKNFRKIYKNLDSSTYSIKTYINEISNILVALSNKNFTVEIEREYLGDFSKLKNAINHIVKEFNEILSEIDEASLKVETGAKQVASTSQNLSDGSLAQASSIEAIGTTAAQVALQTKENADNASRANNLSSKAKVDAEYGKEQMGDMLKAMNEIKNSSQNISKVNKVIDEIAFQTNILSLNAAVEAARAGQHGKGFAVVADEVRRLANKSAKAAKEATELIDSSIRKVSEGNKIAIETSDALNKIVTNVIDSEQLVKKIADDSNSQAISILEINKSIEQMSAVIQANTAASEESASTSEEMAGQAEILKNLTHEFKLLKDGNERIGYEITRAE